MAELSPMMQQYFKIKEENKDSILFFRLGDFYEMFYDDAKLASKELELTLTGRDCGQAERAPMCGVPFHSCEGYIARLVAKGYKVAICEQMEDPATAKGIVKREVVRIATPGTNLDMQALDETKNNYIMCVVYMVFACNNALADTLAMRKATADVVYSEHTGLRVPLKAVHMDDDGQTFVYVVTAAQLEKKTIEINGIAHVTETVDTRTCTKYGWLETTCKTCGAVHHSANATAANRHMIDANAIAKMKNGVVLINTARGTLIDPEALVNGLESGKIGAAGLDVVENENGLFYFNHMGDALQ